MLNIYIDADGCPVKDETYKVAMRYKLNIFVVANKHINIPLHPQIEMVVVPGKFDAADDWIVEHITKDDIAITADILLADRLVKKEARVLGPKGKEFNEENIGMAVASRDLMAHLRQTGEIVGGQKPISQKDKSYFLQTIDQIIQSIRRKNNII